MGGRDAAVSPETPSLFASGISVGTDAAKSPSLKMFRFIGHIPVFWKPLTAVSATAARRYAPLNSSGSWRTVTTTWPRK